MCRPKTHATRGFTLTEIMVVIAIIGIMMGLASAGFGHWQNAQILGAAARTIEGAFGHARDEAVRTGNNHIVFVLTDISGASLAARNGDPATVLVLDDGRPGSTGQNCSIDSTERIAVFPLAGNVGFGVTSATGKVYMDDGVTSFGGASTFAQTGGGAASWVLFTSDGAPRSINAACQIGALGSGGGGIYLSNADRDVAVVLTALGASRVFSWNSDRSTWN